MFNAAEGDGHTKIPIQISLNKNLTFSEATCANLDAPDANIDHP